MTLANAHPLFVGLRNNPSYLAGLDIEDDEHQKLMNTRTVIRGALRDAAGMLEQQTRFWRQKYLIEASNKVRDNVSVKFLTQGSFAYKTLNAPAQPRVQEIDLDDGMYVPVRFLEDSHPALAADGLFTFVEETLKPVCVANGWELDTSKNTCARVRLWAGAHVDIPIYSVPENQFQRMKNAIEESAMSSRTLAFNNIPRMAGIPSDLVMLAQRNGGWVQSDPKQLHDWVNSRADRYGPIFRRLCRFFKGWRDHIWENSPLSSICLMCAIDLALIKLGGNPSQDRDDKQIMDVAEILPEIFKGEIQNPVVQTSCLNDWNDNDRKMIVSETERLAAEMESALEKSGNADIVVDRLRNSFGRRIPNRPDVIKIEGKAAATARAAPAVLVPTPEVISSDSG